MTWIEHLESETLKYWLTNTDVPMMSTMPDGQILWVNPAYERLTGYSSTELYDMTWTELTEDKEDRDHDFEMAAELVIGGRSSYQFSKQCKHKTSRGPQVLIDVLRYPMTGDFTCFLVSIIPLDRGYNQAIDQVEKLHKLLLDFIELQKKSGDGKETNTDKILKWSSINPIKAGIALAVALVFILGDRLLEITKDVMDLFSGPAVP